MPTMKPIPMILFCPRCQSQHIDRPNHRNDNNAPHSIDFQHPDDYGLACINYETEWTNPPHKSHLCAVCGCIWRPADVPTEGVVEIQTKGSRDNWEVEVPMCGLMPIAGVQRLIPSAERLPEIGHLIVAHWESKETYWAGRYRGVKQSFDSWFAL